MGTGGHHDCPTLHDPPILEPDDKPGIPTLDRRHVGLINPRHRPLLKPEAIVDERLKRQGKGRLVARVLEELRELMVLTWIGEVGREQVRSEQHALRHVFAPQLQRLAEDGNLQSSAEQMCCSRETIRTRSDDHDINSVPHEPFLQPAPNSAAADARLRSASCAKCVVALIAGSGSLQFR